MKRNEDQRCEIQGRRTIRFNTYGYNHGFNNHMGIHEVTMNKNENICGLCKHHRNQNEEWVCCNPESENYGDYTEYNDSCEEFDERNTKISHDFIS